MKTWLIVVTAVVLVLTISTGSVLYARLHTQLSAAQVEIAKLKQTTSPPSSPTGSPAITMVDLIATVQPVIVRVDVTGADFRASGSGVIIRADGHVITNAHVVEGATSITVTLSDDRQFPGTVTASDAHLDLAIVSLTGGPANLPAIVPGSSGDIVIGGVVVAAGFPLGPELPGPASFTQGIVSAVRTVNGQRYVQSDVVINPGNSGGALVARTSGRLVGITSAAVIQTGGDVEGINLAIPIDVVQRYIQANLK